MRRIFTSAIAIAAAVFMSNSVYSQTCSLSATPVTPSPGFSGGFTVTSAEGFSGNRNPLNQFPISSTSTLVSPIFYYDNAQTAVYTRLKLATDGNNKASSITAYTISVKYGSGVGVVQSCSQTGLNITIPGSATGTDFFATISGINIPGQTNFQVTISLTIGGSTGTTNNVIITDYRNNAIQKVNGALPVNFTGINARLVNGSVNLNWTVDAEEHVLGYEVEKSNDGRNFAKLGTVAANKQMQYSFVDATFSGTAYYRVKSVDVDGKFKYTSVVSMKGGKSGVVVKAFPTITRGAITVQHDAAVKGSSISIASQEGRIVKSVLPGNGAIQTNVDLSSLQAGIYLVRYNDGLGNVETLKVVKQ